MKLELPAAPESVSKEGNKLCKRCGVAKSGAGRGNNRHGVSCCFDGVKGVWINIPHPQPPQVFVDGVIQPGQAINILRKILLPGFEKTDEMEKFIWMVLRLPFTDDGKIDWEANNEIVWTKSDRKRRESGNIKEGESFDISEHHTKLFIAYLYTL